MAATNDLQLLKDKLAAERAKLLATIAVFPPDELTRPFPGGWSAKDILAHLAIAETVNVKLARLMLETDHPVQLEALRGDFPDYPGLFSLDHFNAWTVERARAQTPEQVLAALHTTRAETRAWLETLRAEDLERTGVHAVWGETTARAMLKMLALHDKMHRADLEKRRK
jgi:hypothetical protein